MDEPDWNKLVGPGKNGEIRLVSETGRSTSWIDRSQLVVQGSTVCVRSDQRAWKRIEMVRITELAGANVPALLADLPNSVVVVYPPGTGEIELHTYGADLKKWLHSRAHDPADAGIARYRIRTWGTWRGPLTWTQLAEAGTPKFGWPIEGTSAEVRKVNVPASIAVSVAVTPLILAAGLIAVIARVPVIPGDGPRSTPSSNHLRGADVPLAVVSAGIAANNADDEEPDGSWTTRFCDDLPRPHAEADPAVRAEP